MCNGYCGLFDVCCSMERRFIGYLFGFSKKQAENQSYTSNAGTRKRCPQRMRWESIGLAPTGLLGRLDVIREDKYPVKPATANEAMTCCDALVSGVTRLTSCLGVAFNTCVFRDIIDNPMPEPMKNNTIMMSSKGVSVRTKDIVNNAPSSASFRPQAGTCAHLIKAFLPEA